MMSGEKRRKVAMKRVSARKANAKKAGEPVVKQGMDEELKTYFEGMQARIVDGVTQRFDGRIDASEVRMKEAIGKSIEAMETKLIAEFWKWGRTSDVRTREAIADTAATGTKAGMLSERLLNVEDRVSDLERWRAGVK
jgi:hypothetical protein